MPCHAMHPIQDLFLESFSYELQFDMLFYVHSFLHKIFYSCKKWVLQATCRAVGPNVTTRPWPIKGRVDDMKNQVL
jgi:hypothetical protein